MKVKVLKSVLDSKTKKRLSVGAIIDISKARAESAIKRGLVEEVKEPKKAKKPKEDKKLDPKLETK